MAASTRPLDHQPAIRTGVVSFRALAPRRGLVATIRSRVLDLDEDAGSAYLSLTPFVVEAARLFGAPSGLDLSFHKRRCARMCVWRVASQVSTFLA